MKELRVTLISDGSSDRALLPILRWVLKEQGASLPLRPEWADTRLMRKSSPKLADKIYWGLQSFPCDILFVHRDAENGVPMDRKREVQAALGQVGKFEIIPPAIVVVPIRMTEAWLLFNESAIREAAGNPSGSIPLTLPSLSQLESLPDPKSTLYELLKLASELPPRRLRKFPVGQNIHRLADLLDEFSALRQLTAFCGLESEVRSLVDEHGWNQS